MTAKTDRPGVESGAAKNEHDDAQDQYARPYTSAAHDYLAAGWQPVPLPYRQKEPPPAGVTGYRGATVDERLVDGWLDRVGDRPRNIGVRAPSTVLGIDVDAYKPEGAATFAEATDRLGKLPGTWTSTARLDAASGIRWYRVPPGRRWADELGPGVEIIHHGHRYGVVAPSVHPDGMQYVWLDELGLPADLPRVDELPELPPEWVAELDRGDVGDVDPKVRVEDVEEWLQERPGGDACQAVRRTLEEGVEALQGGGSRHSAARAAQMRLVRLGEQGHAGSYAALGELETAFRDALAGDRPHAAEWERMLAGAVAVASAAETPWHDRGCCPGAEPVVSSERLFDATPTLQHIRTAAYARMVSPAGVLAYLLGRVLAEAPIDVTLPPTVGSPKALNFGVAAVGGSGGGKSSTEDVSRELLGFPLSGEQADIEVSIGSGEGLVQTFLRFDTTAKENVLIGDPRRIVLVDEIDQLAAVSGRSGSTLGPNIRTALTGGTIGSENAEASRKRRVPGGRYRLVLIVGVQPKRSGALLSEADRGTPQRFLWVDLDDGDVPDEEDEPDWPGELDWEPPAFPGQYVEYPEHIAAEVKRAARARRQGKGDPNDGHLILLRLKAATALALLHGETSITDRWWELAGRVVAASNAVQARCRTVLADETQRVAESRAIVETRAQDKASEDRVKRLKESVKAKLQAVGGEWLTKNEVRAGSPEGRAVMPVVLAELRRDREVEVVDYTNPKGTEATKLRWVGKEEG